MKQIISLGAGVQSSCMVLMAARGEFKDLNGQEILVDAAIFADTQAEPAAVMRWLDALEELVKAQPFPFPIYRVTAGNLGEDELRIRRSKKSGRLYLKNSIPAFVLKPDGKRGLLGRRCTGDYKIVPVQRKVKELAGVKRAGKTKLCQMWIGISTDEASRMKPSRVPYIENIWPLIDVGMSRKDCLAWMKDNGFHEPPRSACRFCPFHDESEWMRLKKEEPREFYLAVKFERDIQDAASKQEVLEGVPFMHESCKPLDEIDFEGIIKQRVAKGEPAQLKLFRNECTGLCGV